MKFKYWCILLQIAAMPFVMSIAHGSENKAALYVEHCKAAIRFSGQSAPNATEALNIGFCLGMMDGLRGANYFLWKVDPASAFCEPAAFDNSDLAKVFVAAVSVNPDLMALRGALAAHIALKASFPCKKENN